MGKILASLIALLLALTWLVWADSVASQVAPTVDWDLIASGGDLRWTQDIQFTDNLGEPVIGSSQWNDIEIGSGFAYGIGVAGISSPTSTPTRPPHRLFLPAFLK